MKDAQNVRQSLEAFDDALNGRMENAGSEHLKQSPGIRVRPLEEIAGPGWLE